MRLFAVPKRLILDFDAKNMVLRGKSIRFFSVFNVNTIT